MVQKAHKHKIFNDFLGSWAENPENPGKVDAYVFFSLLYIDTYTYTYARARPKRRCAYVFGRFVFFVSFSFWASFWLLHIILRLVSPFRFVFSFWC